MLEGFGAGLGAGWCRAEPGRRDCNVPCKRCKSPNQGDSNGAGSNGAGKKWPDPGPVLGKGPTGFAGRLAQEKERREWLNIPLVFCGY